MRPSPNCRRRPISPSSWCRRPMSRRRSRNAARRACAPRSSSAPALPRSAARRRRRATSALRQVIERYGIIVCGPNSEGIVNPLKPLVATFSPVFHDPKQSLFPQSNKSRAIAVSCQSGALTFAFLSRGRPRQLRFTYQASAGNQIVPRSARLHRLADRCRRRRHLHRLSRKHPGPGALPRRRRQGGGAPGSR